MPTKRSSSKKKATKKGAAKAAAKIPTLAKVNPCIQACVRQYIACLKHGGSKAACFKKLVDCTADCL